jgi:NADPH2:quinone reductase
MPGLQKSLLQHTYLTHPSALSVSLIPTPPLPAPNELLISVAYIGIGFADLLVITWQYQNKPKLPFAGGTDWSGTILEVGNGEGMSSKWKKGQRVFGISILQNVASMPTIRGYLTRNEAR